MVLLTCLRWRVFITLAGQAGKGWVQGIKLSVGVSSPTCGSIELLHLLGVGALKELIQVVLGGGLVLVPHVGELVRGDLGSMRQVDVLSLHEGSIDVLLVDVLDHGLNILQ